MTTDVAEATNVTDGLETENVSGESSEEKRKRERDFSKVRKLHEDLSNFINANSGLEPVTPNQVKAVLYLRADFNQSPEQEAKRTQRKAAREAQNAKYEGMSEDQKKAHKAAERKREQAERLNRRAEEAKAEAEKLLDSANASGEDLAAVVNAAQGSVPEASTGKRGLGSKRR